MIPYEKIAEESQVKIIKANPGYQRVYAYKNKNKIEFIFEDIIAWYIDILTCKNGLFQHVKPIGLANTDSSEEDIPVKTPNGNIYYYKIYNDINDFLKQYELESSNKWKNK